MDSAPRILADAICYICRNDGSGVGLVTACGCHSGAGLAHVACLVRQARVDVKEYEETGGGEGLRKWQLCFVCQRQFYGAVKQALGWACWKEYVGSAETKRCGATPRRGVIATAPLRRRDYRGVGTIRRRCTCFGPGTSGDP